MFDQVARKYDTLNHVLSLGRDIAWRRQSLANWAPASENAKVLDLCGGTGDFSLAWQKKVGAAFCVVGDFSLPMLAEAQRKGKRGPTQPQAKSMCVALDAMQLPFPEASFDVVVCGFGMRNLDSTVAGIAEVYRILKPGGTFLTLEFFRPIAWFPRFFYQILAPLFIPIGGWLFGSKREAYTYLVESIRQFCTAPEYAEFYSIYGFEKIKIRSFDFGIAHAVSGVKPEEKHG